MFLGSKQDLNTCPFWMGRGQGGFLMAEHGPDCLSEGEGCKLCPTGWMLHGSKCYWVTDMIKSWSKSQDDCRNQGAELVMPGDQEELVKGPMASGPWDGSQGCTRGAGGT